MKIFICFLIIVLLWVATLGYMCFEKNQNEANLADALKYKAFYERMAELDPAIVPKGE